MGYFTPRSVEIKVGENVTWHNPMVVAEPLTVTFIKYQNYFPPPAAPFAITNSTELKSLLSDPNIQPLIVSSQNGTRSVIVDKARNYNPVAIDSTGNNVTYLASNGKYSLAGDEKFVNSGWIWPEGMSPLGLSPINVFTVTFEKPGSYHYICIIHPWMIGVVTVKQKKFGLNIKYYMMIRIQFYY